MTIDFTEDQWREILRALDSLGREYYYTITEDVRASIESALEAYNR